MNNEHEDLYKQKEKQSRFFSPDGLGTEIFRQVGGLIVLTVLWLLGCLPIVTIGTSTAALYYAVVKSVRKNHGQPWTEFARAFKRNLKRGIGITCIFLLISAVIGYEIWLVEANGLALGELWTVASRAMLILLAIVALFIFPVMSRFDVSFTRLWKLTFVIATRSWYMGILYGLLIALMIVLQWQVLPMPMILITPAVTVYIGSYLMERAMRKYMPLAKGEEEEWYS